MCASSVSRLLGVRRGRDAHHRISRCFEAVSAFRWTTAPLEHSNHPVLCLASLQRVPVPCSHEALQSVRIGPDDCKHSPEHSPIIIPTPFLLRPSGPSIPFGPSEGSFTPEWVFSYYRPALFCSSGRKTDVVGMRSMRSADSRLRAAQAERCPTDPSSERSSTKVHSG